jgi:hypothetical protein
MQQNPKSNLETFGCQQALYSELVDSKNVSRFFWTPAVHGVFTTWRTQRRFEGEKGFVRLALVLVDQYVDRG